jgi:hypothetical protein
VGALVDAVRGVVQLAQMLAIAVVGMYAVMAGLSLATAAYSVAVAAIVFAYPNRRVPVGVAAVSGVAGAVIARILTA